MTERIYKFDFFNPQDRNDVIEFLKQYFKQDLERAMRYLSQTPVRANKEDEGINEDSAAYSLLRQKQDFEEKLKATKDENKKVIPYTANNPIPRFFFISNHLFYYFFSILFYTRITINC